jgi:hypothetical protein
MWGHPNSIAGVKRFRCECPNVALNLLAHYSSVGTSSNRTTERLLVRTLSRFLVSLTDLPFHPGLQKMPMQYSTGKRMNRENITNSGEDDGDERERPRIQRGAINPENG